MIREELHTREEIVAYIEQYMERTDETLARCVEEGRSIKGEGFQQMRDRKCIAETIIALNGARTMLTHLWVRIKNADDKKKGE